MIAHVSYSQIKTFASCPRKWWINKIAGVATPSTPATELGSAVHTAIESYLVHGTPFPSTRAGQIATHGAHLLPAPGSCTREQVERAVLVPIGVLPFKGVVDFIDYRAAVPAIVDHKTTSDARYADTPEALAGDWQMLSYAAWAFSVSQHPALEVRKNYFSTKSARAWSVSATVTRADVDAVVPEIARTVDRMVDCAAKGEADAPQNYDHCAAYGGCPFRSRCFGGAKLFDGLYAAQNKGIPPMPSAYTSLDDAQLSRLVALFPPVANLLGSPRNQQEAGLDTYFGGVLELRDSWVKYALTLPAPPPPVVVAPPPPVVEPAAVNPPEQVDAASSVEVLAEIQAVETAKKSRDVARTPRERDMRAVIRTAPLARVKQAVLDDLAPALTPAYEHVRTELRAGARLGTPDLTNPIAAEYDARGWSITTVCALLAPPVVAPPPPVAAPPVVVAVEPPPPVVVDVVLTNPPSYVTPPAVVAAIERSVAAPRPRVLLIDACVVSGEQATQAHVVFADVIREVAEHLNVPHYAFPDFRKGERTLAAQLARRGWPEGVHTIALDSRGNVYPTLFEHLVPLADVVVRGYGS